VLSNRVYEGRAVYHPGDPDEEAREGDQERPSFMLVRMAIPEKLRTLWPSLSQ
jgi:hypothetical protein